MLIRLPFSLSLSLSLFYSQTSELRGEVSRLRGEVAEFKTQASQMRDAHQTALAAEAEKAGATTARHEAALAQVWMQYSCITDTSLSSLSLSISLSLSVSLYLSIYLVFPPPPPPLPPPPLHSLVFHHPIPNNSYRRSPLPRP